MGRAKDISELAADVLDTEYQYLKHGDRHNQVTTPWMPYQPADFISILWECMPEITYSPLVPWYPTFLDVGCGPGTKMRIARDLFGFTCWGVEIDAAMAVEARKHFPDAGRVTTGDALDYGCVVGSFDVIWLYRPFRDAEAELVLEQQIISGMKPGAVLAGSSWETDPGLLGWNPVVDDCLISPDGTQKIVRGAWKKPQTSE